MVVFNDIPADIRTPGQYFEFAPKPPAAQLSTLKYDVLLIGQATDGGSVLAKVLTTLTSSDQAAEFFGFGSQIHLQARAYFKNNNINTIKAIAATVDPIATPTNKSTGTVQITAAATGSGSLILYIAGQRIAVGVTDGDSANAIAAAINTEIVANHPDLPVTSAVVTDTITLTAKNIGVEGDNIDIRLNFFPGEKLPNGVTVAIVAMAAGAATPDISNGSPSVLDQLAGIWFQIISMPYTDDTNFDALRDDLEAKFGPTVQQDGVAITSKPGTQTALVTFGSGKNTKQIVVIGTNDVPEQPLEVAAAAAGQVAQHLAAGNGNESKPFQTLPLNGIKAPRETSRFSFQEREGLLNNGIATVKADSAGVVRIERLITTWQKNASGAADITWLDANTRFTAMFIRFDWVQNLEIKFPQA